MGRVGRGGRGRDRRSARGRSTRCVLVAAPDRRGRGRVARCSSRSRSRSARRISSRCASTACSCTASRCSGLVGLVGASYLLDRARPRPRADRRARRRCSACRCSRPRSPRCSWVPARRTARPRSRRGRVYGEGHAPDEVLRTFGSRLTRALPLDELLLQLAESLKATMNLEVAEVWTGADGIERAVSVPDRGPAVIPLGPEEETGRRARGRVRAGVGAGVAARDPHRPRRAGAAHRAGHELGRAARHDRRAARAGRAPVHRGRRPRAHRARPPGRPRAAQREARLRAAGVARRGAPPSRRAAPSRARIVEATDTERRRIERNLHDGAQQHLVALAVGVRLARQISDTDPEQAKTMLDQIGLDLQEAVQELRNLAHGIYPPLLMDRGLPEALRAAAGRAALPDVGGSRGHRPLPAAGRGRRVLLLPRSDAERGQARGRGRATRW